MYFKLVKQGKKTKNNEQSAEIAKRDFTPNFKESR